MNGLTTIGLFLFGQLESAAQCNAETSALIRKAEELHAEGHCNDAIPLYQQILQTSPQSDNALILHLAGCYLEICQPNATLDLLSSRSIAPELEEERIFLMSSAFRLLNEHQNALHLLISLPRLSNRNALEKGLNLFYLKQIPESRLNLQTVDQDPLNPDSYYLAQLYLARIALAENQIESAGKLLKQVELPSNHPLLYEKAYLEGLTSFLHGEHKQAIAYFEQALPQQKPCPWAIFTQRYIISSYLHLASQEGLPSHWIAQVNPLLEKLLAKSKEEIDYLLLGDFYLIKARQLQDPQANREAQLIFSNHALFKTSEARKTAALKLADTLPTYCERKEYYQQLLKTSHSNPEILFWQAWNDFKEGVSNRLLPSLPHLEEASKIFKQSYILASQTNSFGAYRSLKYYILANLFLPETENTKERAQFLYQLMEEHPDQSPECIELHYLTGLFWKRYAAIDEAAFPIAEKILTHASACQPSNQWTVPAIKALAQLHFQRGNWADAETIFARLLKIQPSCCEALFWQALCAEKLGQQERKQTLLQKIYAENPQDPVAPAAYFYTYSYREYLKGPKKAIKHLQAMPTLFSDHPLLINAFYLIGMDQLKDHLADDGTLLRRKDVVAAIDAFQKAESTFQELNDKKLISTGALPYFIQVHFRATLERALANLAVAEASQGAKQMIYLEYAESVFYQLNNALQNPTPLINEYFVKNDPYPRLLQESEYWLARTYLKRDQLDRADEALDRALKNYEAAQMKQGYLLSRIWYEKGKMAQMRQEYQKALDCFAEAETAAEGRVMLLSPDQKLDLWIQQSLCYKEMKEWDKAMFLLSKAVNDEAICSLRVKAMYLRAEIYELQGRPELALKQLEAVSRKGGEWGMVAKEKLENSYGY
ncbi:MAG: tetratricopeptide repeat protein [Chlamydiales bacterium]